MSLIVIEGPDGAGKTTLIKKIAKDFKLPVYTSGGPKDIETMLNILREMAVLAFDTSQVYLCDRAPWISERVYSKALSRKIVLPESVFLHCLNLPQRIIYCALADSETMLANMSREFKAHKPAEHTTGVITNYKNICKIYGEILYEAKYKGLDIFSYDWQNTTYKDITEWVGE